MGAIELLTDRAQLTLLQLTDGETAPPVGGPDDGRVHELQHGTLPEGMRDDFGAPSLFEEEPLEQVCSANHAPMAKREAQVRRVAVHPRATRPNQRLLAPGQWAGLPRLDGRRSPEPLGRQQDMLTVEVRPLTAYDQLLDLTR